MAIVLDVRPGPALTREQFLSTHPPCSIALDGYVFGAPFLEVTAAGPFRNFNHHEVVDRSCTSSTCEQARRAVLLGLYDLFRVKGERTALLCVNDCDQDVCLSTWILMNPERAAEPLVRVLSQIVDLLDMSAGAFPLPHERDLLGEIRWVFEPYTRARPTLASLDAAGQRAVIDDVHARIDAFVFGRASVAGLVGEFDFVHRGDGWVLATVTHQSARERMVAQGVRAAVELTSVIDGRHHYALWRRSEYVTGFPVPAILAALNRAEGHADVDVNGWGGAANVGGSPRKTGSGLAPDAVAAVVDAVVAAKKNAT